MPDKSIFEVAPVGAIATTKGFLVGVGPHVVPQPGLGAGKVGTYRTSEVTRERKTNRGIFEASGLVFGNRGGCGNHL